jgi:hypothetical protein
VSIFRASDEQIRDEIAQLTAARDLEALAGKLCKSDARWRDAAAGALAPFGADAAAAVISQTLTAERDADARKGAWAAFERIGAPAAPVVLARVASVDTLLADDVRATLRYYQRAISAVGPSVQDQVAALVRRGGPWRDIAEACLRAGDTRPARINTDPVAAGVVLVPVRLGPQRIDLDEAEEAIRATSRQWAVTCLLGFAGGEATLDDTAVGRLEEAVVDALDDYVDLESDGLPIQRPLELMRRHEAGDRGVLPSLENDVLAPRASPSEHPPEERRRREDLLVGTLALGVLRRYSHHGVGAGLTADTVAERFAALLAQDRARAGGPDGATRAASEVAGFVACCAMHLRENADAVADRPPLAGRLAALAAAADGGALDRELTLETAQTLRRG